MAAGINDRFTDTFNSANPNVARVTAGRTAGALSLTCDNLAGWPTGTAVHFSTYQINTSNAVVAGTQIDWKGIVSGNSIGTLTRQAGATDAGNSIGDVVEMNATGSWGHDYYTGMTAQHNQDGTHGTVTATSVSATGVINASAVSSLQDASTALSTYRTDYAFDFVQSGLVWSGLGYGSTLTAAMTSGVVYINGQRLAIGAVATRTFTASKDTYIDILNTAGVGSIVYTEVANNAASPALAANSIRIGIIVTGVANIAAATSVNQGQETMVLPIASSIPYAVTDSLGNLICPRDPNRKILGYRQIVSNFAPGTTAETVITGLTVPVIIPAGRKIKGTAFFTNSAGSTGQVLIILRNGTTTGGTEVGQGNSGTASPAFLEAKMMTSAYTGSQNFVVTVQSTAGNPTVGAATQNPGFVMIELA